MGKLLRKTLALVLVMVMILSCSAVSFAEETEKEASMLMTVEELRDASYPEAPAEKPAVMLNGSYVAFTDARPQNVEGRIMVPFRAILEAMGAVVDYDKATKEISAVLDGKAISFYAGKPDIVITENGETSTITMDVVPFIQNSRTFVSTRFVAEAFGLSVGWDSDDKTVIIIDFAKMIPEIAEKFTVLGMLCDNSATDKDKNYSTSGYMKVAAQLEDSLIQNMTGDITAKAVDAEILMDINGVTKGLQADMTIDFETSIEDLYPLLGVTTEPQKAYIDTLIEGLDMKIKMDDENICISMPLLDAMMAEQGYATGEDTWYTIPLSLIYDTYEDMGMDFESMMNDAWGVKDLEGTLEMMIPAFEASMSTETYLDVCAVVALLDEVVGDDCFRKSGSKYTLSIDEAYLAEKIEMFSGETKEELLAEWKTDGINFDLDIVVSGANGNLSYYEIGLRTDIGLLVGIDGTVIEMEVSGRTDSAVVALTIDVPELWKATMEVKEAVKEVRTTPDVKVPSNATIINLMDLM